MAALTSTERSRKRRSAMTAADRTAYHTKYSVRRREQLIRDLAPDLTCGRCGLGCSVDQLLVDHVHGRLWLVERMSASVRAARYHRERNAGVAMRALCARCSGHTGGGIRYHGLRPKLSSSPAT